MSLFVVENGPHSMEKPSRLSKSDRFRLQIRRKQQEQIFKSVRKQFVDSLRCLNFLEELKSQKDNMTAKKIHWLIEGLEGGQNNASFYQDISDMQLESYLCDVILNEEISLENKTKIMKSLVQLTYFSCKIPKELIENNLIDYFRVELNKINMCNEAQQIFAFEVASLVLNLTSFKNQSFNYHMIQSDFLPVLQKLIDRNQSQRPGVVQIRQILLKIYANLFRSQVRQFKFICNVLRRMVLDERNSANEDLVCCTLSCLVQAAKIPNFWFELQNQTTQNGEICGEILVLAQLIDSNFTENTFFIFIDFLIALYEQEASIVTEQANLYIRQLPKNFFFNSFCKLKKNQENTKTKKIVCRLIKLASKVDSLYKIMYSNNIERQEFVSGIMQRYVVTNPISRKYLARVLSKVLGQDKCAVDILINNGIIDIVRDLLDSQYFKDEKVDVIDLVWALIEAEEDLRDKTKDENKIINVFEDRGIIRDIQKLQDDQSEDLYRRAQSFMAKLCKLKAR